MSPMNWACNMVCPMGDNIRAHDQNHSLNAIGAAFRDRGRHRPCPGGADAQPRGLLAQPHRRGGVPTDESKQWGRAGVLRPKRLFRRRERSGRVRPGLVRLGPVFDQPSDSSVDSAHPCTPIDGDRRLRGHVAAPRLLCIRRRCRLSRDACWQRRVSPVDSHPSIRQQRGALVADIRGVLLCRLPLDRGGHPPAVVEVAGLGGLLLLGLMASANAQVWSLLPLWLLGALVAS